MKEADELRLAKEEKLQRLQMEHYQRNPLAWVRDRMGEDTSSYMWSEHEGYENHKWDGDKDPLARAWQDLANFHWVGIESATGTGKTYTLARIALWFLDCFPNSLVVTSAPKQDQLRLNLWSEISRTIGKFRRFRPDAELRKLKLVVDNSKEADGEWKEDDEHLEESWMAVGFVAGTSADEESANRARGFHREHMLIILEECPGMPMSVLTAFQQTSVGDKNMILAVGNPDSEFDPLHQFCIQHDVKNYRISAYDFPNVVMGKNVVAGAVTQRSIDRRAIKHGVNSPLYQAMVRGLSPAQSKSSLIQLEWIEQCEHKNQGDQGGYNAIGIDVANSEGGDKAAVAYGQGNVLMEIKEFFCPNATHLAFNIAYDQIELEKRNYTSYDIPTMFDYGVPDYCIGIDGVGIGVATVNAFLDLELREIVSLQGGQWLGVIPVDEHDKPMYRFNSLRSQMWWQLREDLRQGNICIDLNNHEIMLQLKKELTVPRVDHKQATIAVEKKQDIRKRLGGKSPNLADAMVYWNWMRNGFRVNSAMVMASSGG